MSTFNTAHTFNTAQMQTDAMLAPVQMEAGRRRNEGIQNIGNAAMQGAQMWNQSMELQIRDAEAATKIAGWQQEQDLNAIKMQQVLALDAAMQSRHQTTLAEVQANTAMMDYEERREAVRGRKQSRMNEAQEYGMIAGMEWDDATASWTPVDEKTNAGRIQNYREMKGRNQQEFSPYLDEQRLWSMADRAHEAKDFESAQAYREQAKALRVRREQDGGAPQQGGQQQGGQTQGQLQVDRTTRKLDPQDLFVLSVVKDPQKSYFASNALNSKQWTASPVWSRFAGDERTRQIMSAAIGEYATQTARVLTEGSGRSVDAATIHEDVMEFAQKDPALMGLLFYYAKDTPEEIRMKLETLFPGKQGAIDFAMRQIDSERSKSEKK